MQLRLTTSAALLTFLLNSLISLAQEAPRYKLEVGQEIEYQSVADYKGLRSTSTSDEDITLTLWVVRRNEDGSLRVIYRNESKRKEASPGHEGQTSQSEYLRTYDVFPDGRVVPDNARFDFPRLPRDGAQKVWRAEYPDGRTDFAMLPGQSTAKDLVFRSEEHTLDSEIYSTSRAYVVHFDLERGLPVASTSEFTQDYGIHVKMTTSSRLKSVEKKDPAFTEQLDGEEQVYSKAVEDYDHAQTNAKRNRPRSEAIMKQAGDDLRRARSGVTLPMFTTELDKILSRHDRVVEFYKQEAQHVAGLLGKPAAAWALKDLTGQSHALADYRGRVVLLDFWYRGCGFCIQAMPQLEQVIEDFKNDPVVVLGINSDEDEQDARFVADKMHLNYATTLLAPTIPAKYGVRAFPTFILIDPTGIVRDVRDGYSPRLREELDQAVRELLPAKGGSK